MKTVIKKALTALALAVGFTTAATAATPVAVWDGFDSLTRGDYTWDKSDGTTLAEGVVIIGSDGGLTMTVPTSSAIYNRQATVIMDVEVPTTFTEELPLIDINAGSSYVTLTTDATTLRQRWNFGGDHGSYAWTPGRQKIAVTYKAANPPGTRSFVNGANVMGRGILMSSGGNLKTLKLGCYAKDTTTKVAEGLKIYKVALFDTNISDADVAAYQFPSEVAEYYTTVTGNADFDTLVWTPTKPETFKATDTLIITNKVAEGQKATLTFTEDVSALKLKVASDEERAMELVKGEYVTVEIGTYDFSEVVGTTVIGYAVNGSVISAVDTKLAEVANPSLVIAENCTLTVKKGVLTASKVSNAGTLNFEGGTVDEPIYITGGSNLGVTTLAEETYVQNDDKGTACKYLVAGSGATSFYTISRNVNKAPGMQTGSTFSNVVICSTTTDGNCWIEHGSFANDGSVGLNVTGNIKLNDMATPIVIRSLSGNKDINGQDFTICSREATEFAGTSVQAITIAAGDSVQTFSGGYKGALTINEGATVRLAGIANPASVDNSGAVTLDYAEDRALSATVSGSGSVVKMGAGAITVTAGQFGDNLVSITGGKIKFTVTSEQAKAGVVLCKAEEDISEYIAVVNEAGEELTGDFTFEDNTLSFRVNSVDFVKEIKGDTKWSDVATEEWINSPESTITLTNTATLATLNFDVPVKAKSLKIVSSNDPEARVIVIPYVCLTNLTIAEYDFSDSLGGVQIDFNGASPEEIQLLTGKTITGLGNVSAANVPSGAGFYVDSANVWLCKAIATIERTSPTTEDVQAFTNFFVGVESGDWANLANWRTAKDGLLAPYQYTKYPQSPEAQNPNWYPACFDGELIEAYGGSKAVTCAVVEGWETKLDFRNGVNVTIDRLKKFANNFMWIDEESSVSINEVRGSAFQYGYTFNVAGNLTIGTVDGAGIPYTYNLGENATVTYTNGVRSGTHALDGGKLIVGGNGIAANATVTGNAEVSTTAIAGALAINEDATLTLEVSGEGENSIDLSNHGTLTMSEGTLILKPGFTAGTIQTMGSARVFYCFTVDVNNLGRFELTSGLTAENVKLFDQRGQPVAFTDQGTYLAFAWNYKGTAAWWDYEFEGDLSNAGSDSTALTNEGSDYWNTASNAIIVGKGTPYRGADWTSEEGISCVMYGKMVAANNTIQIGFGNVSKCVMLATGDTSKEEVILYATPNGSGVAATKLCTMSVPNAQTAKHLYAFVMRTVDSKTVMDIYLDGKLLQPYEFDGIFTLAGGFQIGSVHGGVQSTGVLKSTAAETTSELDVLLVYKTALSAAAIQKLADEEYPYISTNGKATRTVGVTDMSWVEDGKWTQASFGGAETTQSAPNANTMVDLTVEEDATLALNLTEQANYEALEIEGEGALTLLSVANAVVPNVSGATTIGTDVTVAYDAITFGNITIADGKTLTFDFASLDLSKEWANRSVKLTGVATLGEDANVEAINVPTAVGRTATLTYSDATKQYSLEIALKGLLTATLGANTTTKFSDLVWKMGEDTVTPDWTVAKAARVLGETKAKINLDAEFPHAVTFTADPTVTLFKSTEETFAGTFQSATDEPIRVYVAEGVETTELPCTIVGTVGKNGPGTLTLAINRNFLVKEGTLKAASTVTATVTVDEGATFDFNGKYDGYVTLNLNGGTVLNNGGEMGTGKRQIEGVTVTSDSTIGGSGNFGLSSDGHHANTLALGTNTLVKTGANTFWLIKTTVTGTGTIDIQAGSIRVFEGDASFSDGTLTGSGTGKLTVDPNLTFTVGTLGNVTVEGAVKVTNRAYYSGIATNVTLAAGARVYFPAGVTHARKDFASKLTREGAISIDAAEGAEFAGTFVFLKAEEITFTEAFKAAIKAAGYAKRETSSEIVYFKPTVITIR